MEERIVSFDNFEVLRISLQQGARRDLQVERSYGLGMVVGAELLLNGQGHAPDDAVLLPGALHVELVNAGPDAAYFLVAQPLAV